MPLRRRVALVACAGVLSVAVPLAGWIWATRVLERRVVTALGERFGRPVTVTRARPLLSGGVRLSGLRIAGTPPLARAELLYASEVDVEVDVPSLFRGRGVVRAVELRGAHLLVVRDAAGASNLGELLERLRGPGTARSGEATPRAEFHLRIDDGDATLVERRADGTLIHAEAHGLSGELRGGAGRLLLGSTNVEVRHGSHRVTLEAGELALDVGPGGRRPLRRAAATGLRFGLGGQPPLLERVVAFVDAERAGFRVRLRAGERMRMDAYIGEDGEIEGEASALGLALAGLDALAVPRGFGLAAARISGHLRARRQLATGEAGRPLALQAELDLTGLRITHERLVGKRPVDGAGLRAQVDGLLRASPPRLDFNARALSLGRLAGHAEGFVTLAPATGELRAELPEQPCQYALEALPRAALPRLDGLALAGRGRGRARVRFDARQWSALEVELDLDATGCSALRDADQAEIPRLLLDHVPYRVTEPGGRVRDFPLGPANPAWTPLQSLDRRIPNAFLSAEDARFYSHHGFDLEYIRLAMVRDLMIGKVERGASTISQQLVKNLYLEHTRSFARKLEEAILTWRLEQVVPKRRILELYLNAVELGPGIFGLREGARAWFGKEPGALSALEATHLAMILPDPRGFWRRMHERAPDAEWHGKLYDLLSIMRRSGRLSAAELEKERKKTLEFAPLER